MTKEIGHKKTLGEARRSIIAIIAISLYLAPCHAHLNESTLRHNYDISYTEGIAETLCILIEKNIVTKVSGQYWMKKWLNKAGFPTKTSENTNSVLTDLKRKYPGCPTAPIWVNNGWEFRE